MKTLHSYFLIVLAMAGATSTFAQVPKLSSYPSASAVIYLDFDGQTVAGTSWNYSGPIYCGASGLDSAKITTIFNRVAEDYRPFDVNITTDSTKYFAAPINKRMRAILTITSDWYGSSGGVAFINSFAWGDNTPCFIFTALLNYNVKNISEALAHEVGHTLGLFHQAKYDTNCVKVSEYNYGQGTGEIGWAPIMGVGYYQNFTLWNNGPNSLGCTNYQSDLNIITTQNGFSFRTDDYSSSFTGATTASFESNIFTIDGVIEQNTDQDLIKFTQPSNGRFQLNAVPYNVGTGNAGSDLDLQITLFNSAQTQLNVYNPGALLSSVIDTILNPGTYYLRIEGKGNMYAPNYASLGSYSLLGSFTANSTLPLRKLELTGQISNNNHILNWVIDADEQLVEQTVEMSTDGRNFSPLNSTSVNDRSLEYRPTLSTPIQYRLKVVFDNGKAYYSNIVTLRTKGDWIQPHLIGNPITDNIVTVSGPAGFDFAIFDLTGKMINKGQLTNGINTINTNITTPGMYLIRYSNGNEAWTDKIIRQ